MPTQFPAYVPGVSVRVHVVGERVFALEVVSDAVDYRYARRDGLEAVLAPCRIPADVAARRVSLAADLGLPSCGIDLRRPDGEWPCFKVNPSPTHSYYQVHTGQPIAAALVDTSRLDPGGAN